MKRKRVLLIYLLLIFIFAMVGCGQTKRNNKENNTRIQENQKQDKHNSKIILTSEIVLFEEGLSGVKYEGDYGFDAFLANGGATSDAQVAEFLTQNVLSNTNTIAFEGMPFGCSTISAKDEKGNALFGRNFDWNTCNAMIVQSEPINGYASISTVNTDFIHMSGISLSDIPHPMQALCFLYAPLDGMNEKGLAVSVNMIQDLATISQNTDKPDITTTTAIRLLLDRAANIEEAIELLKQYDMHASMGYMMHLALADKDGRSVVVEYINNEMIVTQTPVVTNFYLAEGEKKGIGTQQSHKRYDILMEVLSNNKTMDMKRVQEALDSVSKDNFGAFESTEWSIVFNQSTGEVHYYHRENYQEKYLFYLR